MASDGHDPPQKHRHSPEDEPEESSKRRKHRHHHHHHRRHHRHHRHHRDGDEETKRETEGGAPLPQLPPSPPPVQNHVAVVAPHILPDYDMEEGEIVDEDGFGAGADEAARAEGGPGAESGEIGTSGVSKQSVAQNMSVAADDGAFFIDTQGQLRYDTVPHVEESHGNDGRILKVVGQEMSGDEMMIDLAVDRKDKVKHQGSHQKEVPGAGQNSYTNGHANKKSRKEEGRTHTARSPAETTKERGSPCLPFCARDHKRVSARSRSRSLDHARDRSRSQSMLEETGAPVFGQDATNDSSDYRDVHNTDDEGTMWRGKDCGIGSRDLMTDGGKECSASYGRYGERSGRHHSLEIHDRYRGESETERERGRSQEQVLGGGWEMDKDRRNEKDRDYGDWEMGRDGRRDKERGRSGDRDRDRKREKEQDRSRDRGRKRDKDRETERCTSKDRVREKERERERERERARERDRSREMDIVREREREKQRIRDKDRLRERAKSRDRDWSREDRDRDRDRDRNRDVSRHYRYDNNDDRRGDRDKYKTSYRHSRQDEEELCRDRMRKNDPAEVGDAKNDSLNQGKENREEDDQEDYQEKVTLQLAEQEEEDLNRIKEESRRRRQAILEKYNSQPLQRHVESHSQQEGIDKKPTEDKSVASGNVVAHGLAGGISNGADAFSVETSFSVGKESAQNGVPASEKISGAGGLGEGTPKSERSENMFCDDIFGESPAGFRKSGKGDGLLIEKSGLHDNWDDAEGYYSYRFGELLDGRYEVTAAHGKGVFSTVIRAKDLKAGSSEPEEVAIKIIRNNDTMYKAGMQELIILKKLVGADPDNRRHCVRFISNFKYRNHLCLVFESLHMNLREVLKKFGRNIGLKLTAVRAYAKQLFIALKHLRNCGVLHCDIKPDNMLVNDAKNVLKLCDFGNAMFAGKNEITPYLVSRFYRAPEIILGLPYDHPLDIWSVGCCLYELYTGKVLFPGPSNNDMLRLHMELKGPFPKKMLRKGAFTDQHFDQDLNFYATEEDPVTKKTVKRLIVNIKPKDIGTIIAGYPGEDMKMLANFKDLLDKIFVLDPEKRMTVSQALNHPFITGK